MPICPQPHCSQQLSLDTPPDSESRSHTAGLLTVRCPDCGHRGWVPHEDLHLVFHAGQEYCFTYGSTPAHLSVWITTEAVAAYRWCGLSQEMLARHAAEWLLLWGHQKGRFRVSPEQAAFQQFPQYLEHCLLPRIRPHVA